MNKPKSKKLMSKKLTNKKSKSLAKKIAILKSKLSKEQKITLENIKSDRNKMFNFLNKEKISPTTFIIIAAGVFSSNFPEMVTLNEILSMVTKQAILRLEQEQKEKLK